MPSTLLEFIPVPVVIPHQLVLGPRSGSCIIVVSMIIFHYINRCFATWKIDMIRDQWKFRNISTSLVHGLISGISSILCLVVYPEALQDLLMFHNTALFILISFSAGYFIYDMFDIILNGKLVQCWEVTLHHIPVCAAMVHHVFHVYALGYTTFILILEINSVFLHLRKLLQMARNRRAWLRRATAVANIFTFVSFRGVALAVVTRGVFVDRDRMTTSYFTSLLISMILVDIINVFLFWRLLKRDFLSGTFWQDDSIKRD